MINFNVLKNCTTAEVQSIANTAYLLGARTQVTDTEFV